MASVRAGYQDHGGTTWAKYDAHLTRAEDKLEAAAQRTEAAFEEHTAGARAKIDQAEDKLAAAARKVDRH